MSRILIIGFLVLDFCVIFPMLAQPPDEEGKRIFESKCARCHGSDGTKGLLGAKNLQTSKLDDQHLYTTIMEGKKIMPSWKKKLTREQVGRVISYVKSLRIEYNQR